MAHLRNGDGVSAPEGFALGPTVNYERRRPGRSPAVSQDLKSSFNAFQPGLGSLNGRRCARFLLPWTVITLTTPFGCAVSAPHKPRLLGGRSLSQFRVKGKPSADLVREGEVRKHAPIWAIRNELREIDSRPRELRSGGDSVPARRRPSRSSRSCAIVRELVTKPYEWNGVAGRGRRRKVPLTFTSHCPQGPLGQDRAFV